MPVGQSIVILIHSHPLSSVSRREREHLIQSNHRSHIPWPSLSWMLPTQRGVSALRHCANWFGEVGDNGWIHGVWPSSPIWESHLQYGRVFSYTYILIEWFRIRQLRGLMMECGFFFCAANGCNPTKSGDSVVWCHELLFLISQFSPNGIQYNSKSLGTWHRTHMTKVKFILLFYFLSCASV